MISSNDWIGHMFTTSMPIYLFPDIDECDQSETYCSMNTECVNLNGTYDCACVTGYLSNEDGNEYKPGPGCGELCSFIKCFEVLSACWLSYWLYRFHVNL